MSSESSANEQEHFKRELRDAVNVIFCTRKLKSKEIKFFFWGGESSGSFRERSGSFLIYLYEVRLGIAEVRRIYVNLSQIYVN